MNKDLAKKKKATFKNSITSRRKISAKCWWAFALVGVGMLIGSLFTSNIYLSVILGVIAFSSFWSILELFHQEKRVQRGWFPKNPKRK